MSNYKRVYFRINASSIVADGDNEIFQNNVTNLFLDGGWNIKEGKYKSVNSCNTVIKDKQELYLHPYHFSGVVKEENISLIENLLKNTDILDFKFTDIYEDVFDITDEEYINILNSKKEEIIKGIIEFFTTKRRNLYITNTWDNLNKLLNKYRIKRLSSYIGVTTSSDIDIQWINSLFDTLVNQNRIVTASTRNGIGYRTISKKDVI